MAVAIYRHENDISLNNREYVLDSNDDVLTFSSGEKAISYLQERMKIRDEEHLEGFGIFLDREIQEEE